MLSLMLCEPEAVVRRQLLEEMESCCRALRIPWQLLLQTDRPEEAEHFLREETGVLALILAVEDTAEESGQMRLARLTYEKNRDNYMLLLLREVSQLEAFVNLNLRPAGVLFKPIVGEKATQLFLRIVQDFQSLHVQQQRQLLLRIGSGIRRLPTSSVLYVEAQNKKLCFYTATQCISVYWSMKEAEDALGEDFLRCHRSYLVNLEAVEEADFPRMELRIGGGYRLPISRSAKDTLRQALLRHENGG